MEHSGESISVMSSDYDHQVRPELQFWFMPQLTETIKKTLPRIIDDLLADNSKRHLTFGDYGASTGSSLIPIWEWLIEYIKQKWGDIISITIIYEDQPENNFNSLFNSENGPVSLRTKYGNVFILACGTGFYEQCVAGGTMDIILCSFSVHWQAKLVCNTTSSLLGQDSLVEEERILFANEAAKNWETFLEKRAKELTPGGVMILTQVVKTDCTNTPMNAICESYKQRVKDGDISQEEMERTTFPVYIPSLPEIQRPFNDASSVVSKLGLRLLLTHRIERIYYRDIDHEDFKQAIKVTGARGWARNVLYPELSGDAKVKNTKLEQIFSGQESHLLDAGCITMPFVIDVIRKV